MNSSFVFVSRFGDLPKNTALHHLASFITLVPGGVPVEELLFSAYPIPVVASMLASNFDQDLRVLKIQQAVARPLGFEWAGKLTTVHFFHIVPKGIDLRGPLFEGYQSIAPYTTKIHVKQLGQDRGHELGLSSATTWLWAKSIRHPCASSSHVLTSYIALEYFYHKVLSPANLSGEIHTVIIFMRHLSVEIDILDVTMLFVWIDLDEWDSYEIKSGLNCFSSFNHVWELKEDPWTIYFSHRNNSLWFAPNGDQELNQKRQLFGELSCHLK